MSRIQYYTQRKASLNRETSSGHSSPSKSPEHYHRSVSTELERPVDQHSEHVSLVSLNQMCHEQQQSERPKRSRGPPVWGDRDKVVLLVDGKRFSICPLLLTRQPNTMLGRWEFKLHCQCVPNDSLYHRMFSSSMDLRSNDNGEYQVAKGVRSPLFKAILVSFNLAWMGQAV